MQTGGLISGVVVDENGSPIKNAQVKLSSQALNVYKQTMTDKYGNYQFEGLMAYKNGVLINGYSIHVIASGYPTQSKGEKAVGDVVNFNLVRNESNTICGTLRDAVNQLLPAHQAAVKIKAFNTSGKFVRLDVVSNDGSGEFCIKGLDSSAKYMLQIVPSSSTNLSKEWVGVDGKGVLNKQDAHLFETGQPVNCSLSKGVW